MKVAIILITIAAILTGGALLLSRDASNSDVSGQNTSNVTIADGKQIIEVDAKGGFNPLRSVAKAGMPTVLRINTKGTFDCSSNVRIPSMNIFQHLPPTGATEIDLGSQPAGKLRGMCGMAMFRFEIDFN